MESVAWTDNKGVERRVESEWELELTCGSFLYSAGLMTSGALLAMDEATVRRRLVLMNGGNRIVVEGR